VGITRVQLYGERASGTKYLQEVLERNLPDVRVGFEFGWKHFFHQPGVESADDCLFVVIYREPLAWLRSLQRTPWHVAPALRGLPMSEFLRHEWWCVWDEDGEVFPGDPRYGAEMMIERDPETQQRFANVLHMRTAKIRNWESLREKTRYHFYLRFEDLTRDPRGQFEALAEHSSLRRRWRFDDPARRRKGGSKVYARFSDDDLDFILHELDVELERRIGYDVAQRVAALRGSEGEGGGEPG
jgi:hypothetical protein